MSKKYKDTFFRLYFNDKTRLLSLCNALTGENGTDPEEIEINTIEETFFSKLKNDISCMYRGRLLILIEQQSTLNPNMPFRFFIYLQKLIEKIFGNELGKMLHDTKQIIFPEVEFYVLYNGQRKAPAYETLDLIKNSSTKKKNGLQLTVEFFNVNSPNNRELLKKSLPLEDYCVMVERVKENLSNGMNVKKAFYEAYKYCMQNRDWMKNFLAEHEWELMEMISTEYDEELALSLARKNARAEGKAEGRAEGRIEEKIEMIKEMLTEKLPIAMISRISKWSEEDILKVANQNFTIK